MISHQEIIPTIKELKPKTNKVKSVRLSELETQLTDFFKKTDPTLQEFINLKRKCIELLSDREFTYKQINFFGLIKSRSEKLALRLQKDIDQISLFDLAMKKLENIFSKEADFLSLLKKSLSDRNYALANNIILENEVILQSKAPNIYQGLKDQLEIILRFSKSFKATSQFSPKRDPILEKNNFQRVYSLYELHEDMKLTQIGQVYSFTYAIDLNGYIFFSRDANHSFHINLCGGKEVRGAGEIYLRKNKVGGIEVTLLNNKSGLYLPTNEFLSPLLRSLKTCEFNTKSTLIQDERDTLHASFIQDRMLFR